MLYYLLCTLSAKNPSFLNDLAAKMAQGPPKRPVGLVKKPAIDGADFAKENPSGEGQAKLADAMRQNLVSSDKQEEKEETK